MLVTENGFNLLKKEEEKLIAEEKKAVDAMVIARGFGDFSENAELDSAKEWLLRTRQRLAEVREKIANAEVFDSSKIDKNVVNFGATVDLEDCDTGKIVTYKIVGEEEATIAEGKISSRSPIGIALRGKKLEEECSVKIPAGERYYIVKKISYGI